MGKEEKIAKFIDAINNDANERRKKIEEEVAVFNQQELEKSTQDVLSESYEMIQQQSSLIRQNMNRDLSQQEAQQKKRLIEQRQQIMDSVFAEVETQLKTFAASPDYAAFLQKSTQKIAALFAGAPLIIYVKPEDRQYKDLLSPLVAAGSAFEEDLSIKIGGIRAKAETLHQFADDTLDARLQQQRSWFIENAGLILEPVTLDHTNPK